MKGLANFFKNTIVLGVIGLLALSIVIWFGFGYIKFGADNKVLSAAARLLIIVLCVMLWLLNLLRKMWFDKRKNKQMLDDIQTSEVQAPEAKGGRDKQQSSEEIAQLNQRFTDAISVLRKSKFKGDGNSNKSLYQLPWYIIIGPPGAGKTTALINSGLRFPLADSHGKGALGGVGGTRNCDWWFTNDAVLIDTAGRYTTQDSHRTADNTAWQGFLRLLKKHRRRQPINGAIIAVSTQDLLLQTPQQRSQQAQAIRSRVDELHQQLGIQFPIYLLFTKCDLIAGFADYFARMTQTEREQVWGFTLPHLCKDSGNDDLADRVEQEFDLLVKRVDERMLARVHDERDPQKRALIQNFPIQLGNLKATISEFVGEVFSANRYQEQPVLRGVYLSSATQEGTPIDRMMAAVSSSFGFGRDASLQQINSGQSFFIHRLFTDIIFPEANVVGANTRLESSLKWSRRIGFAVLALGFAATMLVWAGSVTRNFQFMGKVNALAESYETRRKTIDSTPPKPEAVTELLEPLRQGSRVYDQEAHPWLTGMGLYDAGVDKAANNLYDSALKEHFLPDLQGSMEQQLDSADNKNEAYLFETLRAYLMLDNVDKRDQATIEHWATRYWQQELPGNEAAQQALQHYLQQLFASGFGSRELNQQLVTQSRQKLLKKPVDQRLYAQLQARMNARPALSLQQAVGPQTMATFGISDDDPRAQIPYLYTKAAYDELDFSGGASAIQEYNNSRWVLGEQADKDFSGAELEKIGQQLKHRYLNDYNNYWIRTINSLHIVRFRNLAAAQQTLNLLAEPDSSPIVAVLELTRDNTELTNLPDIPGIAPEGTADKLAAIAPGKFQPTIVDTSFKELNALLRQSKGQAPRIDKINAALAGLRDEVGAIAMAANSNEAAFAKSQGGGSENRRRVMMLASSTPTPVSTWLQETSRYSTAVTMGGAQRYLGRLWRGEVCDQFNQALAARFPFDPDSRDDANIEEFNSFFGPGGVQASFFDKYLASFIDRHNWKLKSSKGKSLSIKSATREQLRIASSIRAAFFPRGSETARISFQLKPIKLDATVRLFELDLGSGQSPLTYTHGPKFSKSFSWSGAADSRIRILFEDLNGTRHQKSYEGEWALFHLIADSVLERKPGSSSSYQIVMQQGGRKARYQLKASSRVNPFDFQLLESYQCTGAL